MKQTAFVTVTILAGLAVVFLAPQWRLSAEESPRFQRQGNGLPWEGEPDLIDSVREPMHNHKPPRNEGGPVMDHLMRRFDEVIARLDRIERRVGAGHNPNGHQPPHGPDHFGNEKRMKDEGRRHDFERHIQDTINDRRRQSEEMAEHVHRTHEEMREQLEERMHQARGMMGQARERFMELNERVEELEEEMRELQERIEALHPPVAEKASQ
ncbi:MAG: hypothetical protein MUQ52_01950, partial [Pirellulales bacterium]|nr:hypothetical protein [Pirellulales bacterium]|tara:strand:+ start:183 stop:815 length:633 start_codon:yes stop_codon:yes gene_type:complete